MTLIKQKNLVKFITLLMILIYCLRNSIKKLNKQVNADLKHLWLNVNKISLANKSKQKKLEGDLKIKLCG